MVLGRRHGHNCGAPELTGVALSSASLSESWLATASERTFRAVVAWQFAMQPAKSVVWNSSADHTLPRLE
jgi:hypothetical protein